MTHTPRVLRLVIALGLLSAVGLVGAALALTDIAHGEPDLTLEWTVLRVAGLLVVAFHAAALWALRRAYRVIDG